MNLLRRSDVLLRLGACCLAAIIMWAVTGAWKPPFPYRSGFVPPRDMVARTTFSRPDPQQTEELRRKKRRETTCVYVNDNRPLKELRSAMKGNLFQVLRAEQFEALDGSIWRLFLSDEERQKPLAEQKVLFETFQQAIAFDAELNQIEQAVAAAFLPLEEHGLFDHPTHDANDGSQILIRVHPVGNETFQRPVEVEQVRIATAKPELDTRLRDELAKTGVDSEAVPLVAGRLSSWIRNRQLPSTLKLNMTATQTAYQEALADLQPVEVVYAKGVKLVDGGRPLTTEDLQLLHREYRQLTGEMSLTRRITHSLADFGMYVALFVLCGSYLYYHQPYVLTEFRRFGTLLALAVVTVTFCRVFSGDLWRAEIIPLVLYGMTIRIAYQREMALLLSASVALIVALSLGQGLPEFVILMATISSSILLLNRVRSRTKLLYVGLGAGLVASLTSIGVGTLVGQAYGISTMTTLFPFESQWGQQISFGVRLLAGAGWFGFCGVLAGLLMTGLLPFIERLFDIQTDISLLELGDAAHPLLQELARRAPGTYNHSINVASLAETAAEAIAANGLLVRVGAYFHDIGKMLKPNYFVENQALDSNRHATLLPAMSTLIIIAHVKDGADLARQHHLPQSIINFIEQHHGTTLVEYFYRQAAKQSEDNPDGPQIDETNFRYPGPKPQSREAGVMMLADAVESACRSLVDPAPARIESLVHDLAMKRLLDGQFEESGLTLQELAIIEDSLVKSLTAVYHGRVKYPGQQQTA